MRGNKLLGILMICALSNFTLFAQDGDKKAEKDSLEYQWDRFSASLGAFITLINSDLALKGLESGVGISVDLEEALGLSTSTFAFRAESEYNFGSRRRSYVRLGYFYLNRNSVKTLESEIEIGDVVYEIGTDVKSKMNLHLIRALYEYSIFRDRRINLGLSCGLYILPTSYSIGTEYIIDETDAFVLPLPVIGFRMAVHVTPRFLIKQSWELLYAKTRHYRGDINDINMRFEYNPFTHFGFGLGFNVFRFSMSASEEWRAREFAGTFKTGFTGLLLYGKYYF
jgi:hypothetical protein